MSDARSWHLMQVRSRYVTRYVAPGWLQMRQVMPVGLAALLERLWHQDTAAVFQLEDQAWQWLGGVFKACSISDWTCKALAVAQVN